jgi:hypothetical protein
MQALVVYSDSIPCGVMSHASLTQTTKEEVTHAAEQARSNSECGC